MKRICLCLFVFAFAFSGRSRDAGFYDYSGMTAMLQKQVKTFPGLMKLESLGVSPGQRRIWCVTLSATLPENNPAVLCVGGIEGVDLAASEICLHYIDFLLHAYGRVDSITQLLNGVTYYIIPRLNPDACEAYFSQCQNEHRLNSKKTDLDLDGFFDEDGPEDLNQDDVISLMRVTDPVGEWLADPAFPEILKKGGTK